MGKQVLQPGSGHNPKLLITLSPAEWGKDSRFGESELLDSPLHCRNPRVARSETTFPLPITFSITMGRFGNIYELFEGDWRTTAPAISLERISSKMARMTIRYCLTRTRNGGGCNLFHLAGV